ncbi:MAG: hypothetical protein KatS3mg110_1770 [Pirellulaceae bacterium]|nr:MAG: hypothetical protein KatS3mg110_1770 [Pirellulaceae bacterium]
MPAVFEWVHGVTPEEIDGLGHVNNVAYVAWMQEAAVAHSEAQGWPICRYYALGCGWVVREHHIEYLRPARLGQTVVVETWVCDFRRISSVRRYRIRDRHTDQLLARAHTLWAFVDLKTFQPRRVPEDLIAAFPLASQNE